MILDQRNVFSTALLGALLLVACGSSSSDKSGGASGGSAGAAGHTAGSGGNDVPGGGSSGTAGSGTAGGADAAGAAGADDGGTPIVAVSKPHSAAALVAGGTIAHSKSFSGVFVLGEAPGGNGVSTGKSGQLRGGVVGASQ